MNTTVQASMLERSPLARFFRWLFSWRGLRRILIVLAWTATILALLYGEENWRGRRAWAQYRRELEAHGEQLDFKAFIPKPVPDAENSAATPFVKSWFDKGTFQDTAARWGDDYARVSPKVVSPTRKRPRAERQFHDLPAWEMGFAALRAGTLDRTNKIESRQNDLESRTKAAPAVLAGLKSSEAHLAELRAASRKPLSQYPVNFDIQDPWSIRLPHLANVKAACQRLQLKACAELAAGQGQEALEDIKLSLYLADSVKDEPILISYLVRVACLQISLQPVWEGLAEHRWSEPQLRELQTRLQRFDFVGDMKRPLAAERAAGVLTADLIRSKGLGYLEAIGTDEPSSPSAQALANLVGRLIPRGWFYQEQYNYCRLFNVLMEPGWGATNKQISPSQTEAAVRQFEQAVSGSAGNGLGSALNRIVHHRVVAMLLLPSLSNVTRKSAMAQTSADQAVLACALERYRLARGQFPETLEALAPGFLSTLPKDVLTGAPYTYRRPGDGLFVLYSFGWDDQDDGGVPGKVLYDEQQGDWVWQYPAR